METDIPYFDDGEEFPKQIINMNLLKNSFQNAHKIFQYISNINIDNEIGHFNIKDCIIHVMEILA